MRDRTVRMNFCPSTPLYSPKCVEGEFSEVRIHGVLRSSAGLTVLDTMGTTAPIESLTMKEDNAEYVS
jgi:hypothetical protein